jgi:hypothetical protein
MHAGLRAAAAFLAADGKSQELLHRNRSVPALFLAISEEKGRAPNTVVPRRVVDRWNYIINGLCVAMKIGDSRDRMSAVRA